MTDIIVYRGAGDKEGEEIFDVLLSEVAPALRRGSYEIDKVSPREIVDSEVVYLPQIRRGMLLEIVNTDTGASDRGVVSSFMHAVVGPTVFTRVQMERAL